MIEKSHNIRNFCIIAHIDHGKSTLADRFLELTHTISEREKKEQILDSMDLERERGITIKMTPVKMEYNGYILNLIDTPGHVDFTYEVSRALAAVEGAVLVVDATQGTQAQTLANLYLALEQNLTIVPVINKIDLKAANVEAVRAEIIGLLGCAEEEIIAISAKTGMNIEHVLASIIKYIPQPVGPEAFGEETKALIFDSYYDIHRGIICDIRMFSGSLKKGDIITLYATKTQLEVQEVGVYTPKQKPVEVLGIGEIGYVVTGIREVKKCEVGDTIIKVKTKKSKLKTNVTPLHGYKKVKPMVFANMYPKDQAQYLYLKEALEALQLNDSALQFEPSASQALGKGFQIGVLGLLHLDIVQERILREYHIEVVLTVPQVEYKIKLKTQNSKLKINEDGYYRITSPQEFPDNLSVVEEIQEPWIKLEIVAYESSIGDIMQLVIARRGEYVTTEYMTSAGDKKRVIIHFNLPLCELLTDFYDKLKGVTSGYGSLNYEFFGSRLVDLVKLTVLVAHEEKEALSQLVPRQAAYSRAREVLLSLQAEIPPHLFEIRLQAQIGGQIIASERIRALRKDVTAKLYGGDVTRKMKLLEKQKKGKKKMMIGGSVDIPTKAYLAVLKR